MDMIFGKLGWDSILTEPPCTCHHGPYGTWWNCSSWRYYLFQKWGYLWNGVVYISGIHKYVCIMYIIVSVVMLLRVSLMRSWCVYNFSSRKVVVKVTYILTTLRPDFQRSWCKSAIFFVAMGLVVGMMNISVPLQIGARDVAFPLLNSLSFWLFAGAAGQTTFSPLY